MMEEGLILPVLYVSATRLCMALHFPGVTNRLPTPVAGNPLNALVSVHKEVE